MATGGCQRELLGGGEGDVGKTSQTSFLPKKLLRKLSSQKSFSRVERGPPAARRCAWGGAWANAGPLGVWEDGGLWTTVAPSGSVVG